MSRPLRIHYPDAWYHVMNRGRRGENIFTVDTDYSAFISLLKESAELWKVNISSYCLMPNHYHLLIQTPQANISRFMRHVNGVYTQRFNRIHKKEGQVFKGRYKSILIGEEKYLLELLRYIHFNPVKAQMVKTPDQYHWSSYQAYVAETNKWKWLYTEYFFTLWGVKNRKDQINFLDFIDKDASEEIYEFFTRGRLPSILGSDRFMEKIKNTYFKEMVHPEVPESKKLIPRQEKIISLVCQRLTVKEEELYDKRRAVSKIPRDIAMFVLRLSTGQTLSEIGKAFGVEKYSTVSTAISRAEKAISMDNALEKKVKRILKELSQS